MAGEKLGPGRSSSPLLGNLQAQLPRIGSSENSKAQLRSREGVRSRETNRTAVPPFSRSCRAEQWSSLSDLHKDRRSEGRDTMARTCPSLSSPSALQEHAIPSSAGRLVRRMQVRRSNSTLAPIAKSGTLASSSSSCREPHEARRAGNAFTAACRSSSINSDASTGCGSDCKRSSSSSATTIESIFHEAKDQVMKATESTCDEGRAHFVLPAKDDSQARLGSRCTRSVCVSAPMRSIDDDTEVPEALFDSLLRQAKEVRGRGQHVVLPKTLRNDGPPKLVQLSLMPNARLRR